MSTSTLRDVAQRAGVSEMPVSRVLRNSGYAAPATRERVLRAASAIGYVPNQIAGSLAQRRTNLVGVLVPSMTNQVYPEVLSGVAKGLGGASLRPVFGITGYDPGVEEGLIRDMIAWRPSGMAVAGLRHTDAARAMLRATSIPVAEMMDTDGRVVEFAVGLSHRRAGGIVAEHLIRKGYRSIAYVAHSYKFDFTARKRFKAFVNVLNESRLSLVKTIIGRESSSALLGRRLTSELLDGAERIDAIYYSNDDMAVGGLMHCLANGIRVPLHGAVFIPVAMQPPLTTGVNELITHLCFQHLQPLRALPTHRQTLLPESVEFQLLPELERQPARSPLTGTM